MLKPTGLVDQHGNPMMSVTIAEGQVIPNHSAEAIFVNCFVKIDFSGSDFSLASIMMNQ